jgi:hypothetical protein
VAGSTGLSAAALSSGQSCGETLVRLTLSDGSLPSALQSPEVSDQLSDEDENDHAFTSVRPRECLGRAARPSGQFNPVAIEHPMIPEELRHSFALGNSVRSADVTRVVRS